MSQARRRPRSDVEHSSTHSEEPFGLFASQQEVKCYGALIGRFAQLFRQIILVTTTSRLVSGDGCLSPRAAYTFLSHGWWSLTRPSSSHLTTASSSFACSTVPNSPFGFPKLPKPSTRSPGFSSWSVAEGPASGGLLARSESAVAPGYDRGGWEALRSLGIGLLVIGVIIRLFLSKRPEEAPSLRLFISSLTLG